MLSSLSVQSVVSLAAFSLTLLYILRRICNPHIRVDSTQWNSGNTAQLSFYLPFQARQLQQWLRMSRSFHTQT